MIKTKITKLVKYILIINTMNNKIFKITYWTNQYFKTTKWNIYFCKSPTSTVRKIKENKKNQEIKESKFFDDGIVMILFNNK